MSVTMVTFIGDFYEGIPRTCVTTHWLAEGVPQVVLGWQ
jgi:hypothetical protein